MSHLAAFPEILPYRQGRLRVSALHEIAFEECGNPLGKPVVVLHGGPGGGSNPYLRRLHDPAHYRIIQFDQRGCGASTPHAELEGNTTWDLVADMEKLREHLGIARWQVMGGSWGSTLALAYAQTHIGRVTELILRGIFTLRRAELLWFYQEGANWLYPDAWEAFLAPIPQDERHDMMAAYYRRLTGPDPQTRLAAARAWSQWEGATLSLYPDADRVQKFGADAYALAFARIECHYFVNRGFFEHDDELLRHAHRLASIPGTIVHGRHDVVTPLATAHLLHKAWPQAQYIIVPDAGHATTEPGITAALVAASERYR
jgi:proline iminopeptidase